MKKELVVTETAIKALADTIRRLKKQVSVAHTQLALTSYLCLYTALAEKKPASLENLLRGVLQTTEAYRPRTENSAPKAEEDKNSDDDILCRKHGLIPLHEGDEVLRHLLDGRFGPLAASKLNFEDMVERFDNVRTLEDRMYWGKCIIQCLREFDDSPDSKTLKVFNGLYRRLIIGTCEELYESFSFENFVIDPSGKRKRSMKMTALNKAAKTPEKPDEVLMPRTQKLSGRCVSLQDRQKLALGECFYAAHLFFFP